MGTSLTLEDPNTDSPTSDSKILTCGIIMPIAAIGVDYSESHWKDVREILNEAITLAGFIPRIVSDSEDSTIIHKSIINNIYNDPIVVCDVSGKNPNVMFELGMRLAFNKPVVIVKDNETGYSFDTSNIQHLPYRKDLRHNTVESFIQELAVKIKATHEAPSKPNYQSFLSHFGKFEIAKIENTSILEADALQKIFDKVDALQEQVSDLSFISKLHEPKTIFFYEFNNVEFDDLTMIRNKILSLYGKDIRVTVLKPQSKFTLSIQTQADLSESRKKMIIDQARTLCIEVDDLPF